MRRLHLGLGQHRALAKDTKIVVFFAPPIRATGTVAPGTAHFPEWRCTVIDANDDALVVDLDGKMIGLSWDHIAGIQFA